MTKGISDIDAANAKAAAEIETLNLRIKTLERIIYECVDVADLRPADVSIVEEIIEKIGCDAYQKRSV